MRWLSLLMLLSVGCTEAPNLRVIDAREPVRFSPDSLVFGPDAPNARSVRTLELLYEGDRPVDLFDAFTDGPFELAQPFEPVTLRRDEPFSLDLAWTAPDDGRLEVLGRLEFDADGHLGGVDPVDLMGLVKRPLLVGEPVDLGTVRADCDLAESALVLRNMGSQSIAIESLTPQDPIVEMGQPQLPLRVPQGGGVWSTTVHAEPVAVGRVETHVRIVHQDGILEVPVVLDAVEGAAIEESFTQSARAGGPLSLLLHLDRSRSMDDDTRALAERIGRLVGLLDGSGREWRLGVVVGSTTGCGVGPIASDAEGVAALLEAAILLPDAHLTEAPYQTLDLSLAYMAPEQCNDGLDLEGGTVHLIVASDEQDQSAWGWELALDRALGVRPDLVVHAVTGPVPDGCETAEPGLGHVDAAWKTGGGSYSICDRWTGILEDLGRELGSERRRWRLSKPALGALEVRIDGVPTQAFTYEPASQGLELATAPGPGSLITVRYRTDAPCIRDEEGEGS